MRTNGTNPLDVRGGLVVEGVRPRSREEKIATVPFDLTHIGARHRKGGNLRLRRP